MKKILWFSNCIQSDGANKASGSWLYSMARLLTSMPDIYLINITKSRSKNDKEIRHVQIKENFEEYVIPIRPLGKEKTPAAENKQLLEELCFKCAPDLIHVWGVENFFSKVVPSFNIDVPKLLEIQGLHDTCAEVLYGSLSPAEIIKCFGAREILFPFHKSLFSIKKDMRERGKREYAAIKQYKYIATQSRWIRDRVRSINCDAKIFETSMSLRAEFWNSHKWEYPTNGEKNFFCSSAGAITYKSIQTAIKATAEVAKIYPDVKLYIIGNFNDSKWINQPGYLTFIKKLVKELKLESNVIFAGPQDANGIIGIMHKCLGSIQTSYVESYSLVVAESQSIGLPPIISFAGAMPELAEDRKTGLFYSPGDYISCAGRMLEIIENPSLAKSISEESFKLAAERNNDKKVLDVQLKIYNEILKNK